MKTGSLLWLLPLLLPCASAYSSLNAPLQIHPSTTRTPTSHSSSSTTSAAPTSTKQIIRQDQIRILEDINEERHHSGVQSPPLILNAGLCFAAQQGALILRQQGKIDYGEDALKRRVTTTGYDKEKAALYMDRGRSGNWDSYYTELYGDVHDILDQNESHLFSDLFEDVGIAFCTTDSETRQVVITLGATEFTPHRPFDARQQEHYAHLVFDYTNQVRRKHGLPLFRRNPLLDMASYRHAQDMYHRHYYSHTSPEGNTQHERILREGYGMMTLSIETAENIAKGQQDPKQVVDDWMNSPSHRVNILSDKVHELGVGVYGEHWVQNFGGIAGVNPQARRADRPMRYEGVRTPQGSMDRMGVGMCMEGFRRH